MTYDAHDFAALVAALPEAEFSLLASCVQARVQRPVPSHRESWLAADVPHADTAQLHSLEDSFVRHVAEARTERHTLARLRLLLVFVLLRYGGLRLAEVLAFDDVKDVDWGQGLLRVRGVFGRNIPLPTPIMERLRDIVDAPECQIQRGSLSH